MKFEFEYSTRESSFIKYLLYDDETDELYLEFHVFLEPIIYENVPIKLVNSFVESNSLGKFYNTYIKHKFKTKKVNIMADKVLKLKIDVTKLRKEWFFQGEKGIYADVTVLYHEKPDQFGHNGMITQDVPKAIFNADRTIRGPILGNCKDWATQQGDRPVEATPGVEAGTMVGSNGIAGEFADDLPF